MKKLLITSFFLLLTLEADEVKNIKNISQDLVKVRAEIEGLHEQISFKKDSYKDKIRSYSNEKSDLNTKISRSNLRIKELQRDLRKIQSDNSQKNSSQEKLVPILKANIKELQNSVKDSIPFKRDERLQSLSDIEHRIDANLITPNKAANQLWAFIEDEMMLGRTSGIYNDKIEIDGTKKLVKVLKIGKLAIFFKTNEEEYGYISKKSGHWQQEMITSTEDVANVSKIFDSFAKQIRSGKFTIKNIVPEA